jgi:hypothetical protein
MYVGDDPSKDFVNLNRVGAKTVRVLTGQYSERIASPGFDGQYCIGCLDELHPLLKELNAGDPHDCAKQAGSLFQPDRGSGCNHPRLRAKQRT